MRWINVILMWLTMSLGQAAELHVTPDGSPAGTGSKTQPLDLATALSGQGVRPGDTIWLRGGVYRGFYISTLRGTFEQPITVRQFPGERAIIDGALSQSEGGSVIYWGFELHNSSTNHLSHEPGPEPSDLTYQDGLSMRVPHVQLINLVVHDLVGNGLAVWSEAPYLEIHGCIIFHNGWQGTDRGHGHGVYCQNLQGTKVINGNIIFNNYDNGIQLYGTSEAFLRNINISSNISFNNGLLSRQGVGNNVTLSGGTPARNIYVGNNSTYNSYKSYGVLRLGSPGVTNLDVRVQSNYFMETLRIADWQDVVVRSNSIAGPSTIMEFTDSVPIQEPGYREWDRNEYYSLEIQWFPFAFITAASRGLSFTEWQQRTGFDQRSLYFKQRPSGLKILVHPNQYERGRANIGIFNWDRLPQVEVDVTGIVAEGAWFEVRNAQDYFAAPVLSGIYHQQPLLLPMTGLSAMQPHGRREPIPPTGPEFNAFVLLSRQAPVIAQVPTVELSDTKPLQITNALASVDWQTRRPRYTLAAGPDGAFLNPQSGVLLWTPVLGLAPTTNLFSIKVYDADLPELNHTMNFPVVVKAIRQPPRLLTPPDQSINALTLLTVTNEAFAGDRSVNKLTFALQSGPAGAQLDPNTGVFRWIPTVQQAASTNIIIVRVTDDGTPRLSATNNFVVRVNPTSALSLTYGNVSNRSVMLHVFSSQSGPVLVERTPTLATPIPWVVVFETNASPGSVSFLDTNTLERQTFYRLRRP